VTKSIPQLIEAVTRSHARHIAIVDGETALNYASVRERIAALAHTLRAHGVRKGDRVALLLPNGLDFVTAFFSVNCLGAVVVPLNSQYQQNEIL